MTDESNSKGMAFDDFMSEADTVMWVGERDPRLRSTIVSVWVLDRMPAIEDFEAMLAGAIEQIPRLRQRVVRDPLEIAPPRWEIDPHFDPAFHFRKHHLGGRGELRDLLDLAEPIAMQAFDKDRPLWEFYLVDGLGGDRAGVIMKLHHAVSDGVGLVNMTKSMIEKTPEAGRGRGRARRRTEFETPAPATKGALLRGALEHRARKATDNVGRVFRGTAGLLSDLVSKPNETLERASDMVGSVRRLLEPITEPRSPVMRDRGMGLSLGAFTVSLADMKQTGRAMGGSLNDVFVTAVAGGLGRYHEHYGSAIDELNMMMPINLRSNDESGKKAGNQFAPARFLVPVGIEDPLERMEAIQERVREQRNERALGYLEDIMTVLNQLPAPVMADVMEGMTTSVDFVTSNVPGPRRATYTAGAKIEQMFPFGPPAGAAVNITLFSYDGVCHVGINADRAAVEDPVLLLECIEKSMGEMLSTYDEE